MVTGVGPKVMPHLWFLGFLRLFCAQITVQVNIKAEIRVDVYGGVDFDASSICMITFLTFESPLLAIFPPNRESNVIYIDILHLLKTFFGNQGKL